MPEREKTAAEIKAEKEEKFREIQQQNLELQNEELSHQLGERKEKRVRRQQNHARTEESLAVQRRQNVAAMLRCNHRKGGKGEDALKSGQGDSPQYSVLHHTYPWDRQPTIQCLRCPLQVKPGETAKTNPAGISYAVARLWPTDNSPSGAAQFLIPAKREDEPRQELTGV